MKKIDNKTNDWEIVYSKFADKLFYTKSIPSTAESKTVEDHVIVYCKGNEPIGIIIENFKYYFYKNKKYRGIFSYIEKNGGDIVEVPNISEYTSNFSKYLCI